MTQLQWLDLYAKVVIVAGLVCGPGFVMQYSSYSPWWDDPIGRTVVAMDGAVFLALFPSAVSTFFQLSRFVQEILSWVEVSAIALVPLILIWRMVVWQREVRIHGMKPIWVSRKTKRGR